MESEVAMFIEARLRVRMRHVLGAEVKRTPKQVHVTFPTCEHATGYVLSPESWAQLVKVSSMLLDLDGDALRRVLTQALDRMRCQWDTVERLYSPGANRILARRFSL